MVNKHTVNYHASPSQLISRIHIQFFPKPLYSAMVAEKFQIYSVKITANTFVSQKIESVFTHAHKKNLPPEFYHYLPGRWELPIAPHTAFFEEIFS